MLLSVTRTLLALLGVCALAWVVLAALARRGIGIGRAPGGARLQVIERLALSPRRHLYLVRADERVFLLGAAEAGALSLIAELDRSPAFSAAARASSPHAQATQATQAAAPIDAPSEP
ncbi:MAG TPA: flagellar biosynthetic protein FliO [Polyangiales bacterium]